MLLPVLAVPASVLMLAGKLSWDGVMADGTTEVVRMADAAAETADRALSSYAIAAARINDRLAELAAATPPDADRRAHDLLAELVAEFNAAVIAFAVDGAGTPIAASHLFPVPTRPSLADRDFFQALHRDDAPAVHISRMFTGRFDGRLFFAVSRGRRAGAAAAEPGRFDGLVTISVDPNSVGASLRRLLPEPTDRLLLLRQDGEPIASSLRHDAPLAADPRDPGFDALALRGAVSGQYWSVPRGDTQEWLVAVRRLDGFPVYARASRPYASMRSRWLSVFAPYLAFGVPAIAALLALSLRVRSDQQRLVQANAALLRDVERSAERLRRAERFALVGTFEVDLRSGASLRSPEYMAVHGLAARGAREVHADWVRRLHPDDRVAAEATLLRAIADDSPATDYAQTYRTLTPAGEVRWIAARGEIERDASGRAVTLRGIHVDVTSLRSTEVALAETDARLVLAQDAAGIGAWEWSPSLGTVFLAPRALDLLGFPPSGPPPGWREVVRRVLPQDRPALWCALRDALATGTLRVELRLVAPGAGAAMPCWLMVRASAIDLRDGKGPRILGVAYDISERKHAETRTALLAREVEHRARNAMTLVGGLVRMTTAPTHEEFVETLEGRIASLAQTITLLGRSRWSGATIGDLARSELAAYLSAANGGNAVRIEGPEVMLAVDAAQHLSMALHELATNSAKYGALSSHEGVLTLDWQVEAARVTMRWTERGGPPVMAPPAHEGFGSFLIRSTVEQQLGGSLDMAWATEGLRCTIVFALDAG
ncbi:PAS domain-containing protein [Roseomonas sp. CECT 9278]|uniref:PAS domain-containing protein n=1 Tax=Roseomonas sp. CECT 9278 TaxID=2845823 RepID=UPI001E34BB9F|nr:PAS domain-containing protein [Roseomonas sp. CECT 9278]